MGVALAVIVGHPYLPYTRKLTKPLLAYSIVGLGAGMDLAVIGRAGLNGLLFTAVALSLTLLIGWWIGRLLRTSPDTAKLINVGTAICGGSAIAAVSSAIHAEDDETSIALGIVFILNACALLIFPLLGHAMHLTQTEFGLWCALAIHDTSSVVGATMQYGLRALQVGTTVKLVRALWIIPVTLIFAKLFSDRNSQTSARRRQYPWFILGFILTSAIVTWRPELQPVGHVVERFAKQMLVATLFLIGSSLTRATLQKVGLRPLIHGVLLWLIVAAANLIVVRLGAVHL
jgi:uncharacterized integral membrane protein (TIGR00698 family)